MIIAAGHGHEQMAAGSKGGCDCHKQPRMQTLAFSMGWTRRSRQDVAGGKTDTNSLNRIRFTSLIRAVWRNKVGFMSIRATWGGYDRHTTLLWIIGN